MSPFTVIPTELCTVKDFINIFMFAMSCYCHYKHSDSEAPKIAAEIGKTSSSVPLPGPLLNAIFWGWAWGGILNRQLISYTIQDLIEGSLSPKILVENTEIEMSL